MVFLPHDMNGYRLRRSVLFMPASNRRALEKAPLLACDSLIFDLEDAVGASEQQSARGNLLELVRDRDFGGRETVIRISGEASPDFAADLEVALACRPDAILLPKAESAAALSRLKEHLAGSRDLIRIWAMIETPLAILNLREIASAGPALQCLVVGPNDLSRTTGAAMDGGREALVPWLMQVIAAARAFGLCALDGVYNDFRDIAGLDEECRQGARMGFDGKTLIHPAQIESANAAFGPSQQELDRARRIVAAFCGDENSGKGAIQIDGRMVERLHFDQALRLLALAGEDGKH